MPHIDIRDLGRVREIAGVLARHGLGEVARLAGLDVGRERDGGDAPIGRRIRRVLEELGPTFIKLGQLLSVRPDIVPPDVIEELSGLQDHVPPEPFERIRAVVEGELGRPLGEVFARFDEAPIASASIAQVHGAVLRDGREVAVKVQRPGIERRIRSDLHILYTLAHVVTGRLELPGLYTPVGVVQEFEAAIQRELDFLQEARAARRFAENFRRSDAACAPEVLDELGTRRVLVMERVRGTRWADLDDPAAVEAAMRRLVEATYLQVFEHGFFHADPHPGNLIVLEDGRLCYLDFGITGTLTGEMQDTITSLFLGLVFREPESVALTLYRAGATEGRVDLKAFTREVEQLLARYHGATLRDLSRSATLMEFVQVAARFRIRLVPEYALLARATSLLDGIARRAMPDRDIVEVVRPYARRLLVRRFSSERVAVDLVRLLQHAGMAVRDVPVQLNQLMLDLERGEMRVHVVVDGARRLDEEIRHATARLAMAVCSSALALGGAVLLAGTETRLLGVRVATLLGVAAGLAGISVFVGLVLHFLVAARLHPREWGRRVRGVVRFFRGR